MGCNQRTSRRRATQRADATRRATRETTPGRRRPRGLRVLAETTDVEMSDAEVLTVLGPSTATQILSIVMLGVLVLAPMTTAVYLARRAK